MKWGTFGPVHLTTLLLATLGVTGLYFALKHKSQKTQTLVLGILSLSGIAAVIFNLLAWGSPWEYLPLHLCSLNALVLPFAVFTRSKRLSNLLLLWSLGAVMAVVMNHAQANFQIGSWTFFFYFVPHVLEFAIPVLLFKLGLVEKDPRCILSTLLITVGMLTAVHFINLGLNAFFTAYRITDAAGDLIQVNYMYTLTPENPVLALFRKAIPYRYWYLYGILPVIAVYLLAVYAPQLIHHPVRKKAYT